MAAHSVTILTEMAYKATYGQLTDEYRQEMLTAMDYAPGMSELQFDKWHELRSALQNDDGQKKVKRIVLRLLAKQIIRWLALNCPDTHEEWVKVQYS